MKLLPFTNRLFWILSLLLFFYVNATAQTYTLSGPINNQGPLLYTGQDWRMEEDHGAALILGPGDGGGTSFNVWSAAQVLPFAFEFYGTPVTQFCVNKNKLLTFDVSVAGNTVNAAISSDNSALPNASLPNNTIAGLWSTFNPPLGTNDKLYMLVQGTAPNRQLWIGYDSYAIDTLNFSYSSIVLEETTNNIYVADQRNLSSGVGSFTVGLQLDGSTAIEVGGSPNISTTVGNGSSSYLAGSYYKFAYVPPPPPIPTMSEWGLIAFGLMFLGLTSIGLYKRRSKIVAV